MVSARLIVEGGLKMKNNSKKLGKMGHFNSKAIEVKVGRTLILGRPEFRVTVSEGTMKLAAGGAVIYGAGCATVWTGKQIGKALGAGKRKIDSILKKAPAAEAEEDFMEQ